MINFQSLYRMAGDSTHLLQLCHVLNCTKLEASIFTLQFLIYMYYIDYVIKGNL